MFNFTSTLLAWKQKTLLHSLELLHFYALLLRRAKQHQSCRQSNRTLVQCQVLMGAYMLFKTMCVVSLNYTQLMVLMCDDGRRLSIKIHRTNSQPFPPFRNVHSSFIVSALMVRLLCVIDTSCHRLCNYLRITNLHRVAPPREKRIPSTVYMLLRLFLVTKTMPCQVKGIECRLSVHKRGVNNKLRIWPSIC